MTHDTHTLAEKITQRNGSDLQYKTWRRRNQLRQAQLSPTKIFWLTIEMDEILISQSEVAITALLTSIDCYRSGNHVSSIILSGAARQILNDLCISNQLPTTTKLIGKSTNKTTKQVHDFIVETYNSLRHADRNPGRSIIVSEAEAKMLIIMAASDLARLNPPSTEQIKKILNSAKSFQEN